MSFVCSELIECHCGNQYHADHNLLDERRNIQQNQLVCQHTDQAGAALFVDEVLPHRPIRLIPEVGVVVAMAAGTSCAARSGGYMETLYTLVGTYCRKCRVEMIFKVNPDERFSMYMPCLPFWYLLVATFLSGCFAVNSIAGFSDRRQIIVFSAPESESGKLVQRSADMLRCQLADRDTDIRFVDIAELAEAGTTLTNETRDAQRALIELARLRGESQPEFEVVLVGKDGGVKARTSDPGALQNFLGLIDSMPMRRAEMRLRDDGDDGCE